MIITIQRFPKWTLALAAVIAVAGLGLAYWLISPLFINVQVDEALPGASSATSSASNPSRPISSSPASSLTALGSGGFYDVVHDGVAGKATLYKQADGSIVLRLTDFKVLNGPDLYVYASSVAKPDAGNINDANSVNLGKLKGNVGDQNYVIPVGTSPEKLKSIVIWCKTFGVNFASASLEL
jgi:Electron transfer DM13